MIVDSIDRCERYFGVDDRLKAALINLKTTDYSDVAPGRYDLAFGVYAVVSRYETEPIDARSWEAHDQFIDVQYVVKGHERIGFAPRERLAIKRAYNEQDDCVLLSGEGDMVHMKEGMFAVFYPEDGHMPCVSDGEKCDMIKVVMKVPVGRERHAGADE